MKYESRVIKSNSDGTLHDVADAICFQNFDVRLSGKNTTIYGKGAYCQHLQS